MKRRKRKTKVKTKVVYRTRRRKRRSMAKYRRYARRTYSRAGGMSGLIAPIVGGVADKFLNGMLPVKGVGATVVGFGLKNSTLKTIGLYEIGASVLGLVGYSGTGGNGGNGGWL